MSLCWVEAFAGSDIIVQVACRATSEIPKCRKWVRVYLHDLKYKNDRNPTRESSEIERLPWIALRLRASVHLASRFRFAG